MCPFLWLGGRRRAISDEGWLTWAGRLRISASCSALGHNVIFVADFEVIAEVFQVRLRPRGKDWKKHELFQCFTCLLSHTSIFPLDSSLQIPRLFFEQTELLPHP